LADSNGIDSSWINEYFGEEYLRLYQFPPERTSPEVHFVNRELRRRESGLNMLDLCCGQGRHAVPLAKHGWQVTGLDLQPHLLTRAEELAKEHVVSVKWIQGDMRKLPFDEEFDVVINLFTAFGYFDDEENAGVIREVNRVLKPGGWFVIDVANRPFLLKNAKPVSEKILPDGTLVQNDWRWDEQSGRYTHQQRILRAGEEPKDLSHSVRVYSTDELARMLFDASFVIDSLNGGFHGEKLNVDAPRLVVIAQKQF
jgi:SAM-dependent methyltransferase